MRSISTFLLPSLIASAYALESVQLSALSGSGAKKLVARQPLISGQFLVPRQADSCAAQGQKACGSGCIDLDWTCCESKAGGCPPTDNCVLGSNGEFGCCRKGDRCSGEGGARTNPGPIPTSPPISSGGGDSSSGSGSSSSGSASCEAGEKLCGSSICIKMLDTCCPDGSGGCPITSTCQKGDDGKYGCCAVGRNCRGSAPGNPNLPGGGGGDPDNTFSIPSFTFGGSRPTNGIGSGDSGDAQATSGLSNGGSSLSGGGNNAADGQASQGNNIKALAAGSLVAAIAIAGYVMA